MVDESCREPCIVDFPDNAHRVERVVPEWKGSHVIGVTAAHPGHVGRASRVAAIGIASIKTACWSSPKRGNVLICCSRSRSDVVIDL
jgi:hypothetical protein